MSKKKFKAGFDDLFNEALQENTSAKESEKVVKHRSSSKSFAANLESLFEDTIKESTAEKAEAIKEGKKRTSSSKRTKPVFGLDALIRETVETSTIQTTKTAKGLKRVTITFDPKKLEKLKSIARVEKAYLKDIVNEVVSDYIAKYEISNEIL